MTFNIFDEMDKANYNFFRDLGKTADLDDNESHDKTKSELMLSDGKAEFLRANYDIDKQCGYIEENGND